jgi:hypothetical protein
MKNTGKDTNREDNVNERADCSSDIIPLHMEALRIAEDCTTPQSPQACEYEQRSFYDSAHHFVLTFSSILNYLHFYTSKFHIYFHRKEFRRKKLLMGLLGLFPSNNLSSFLFPALG